MTPLVVEPASCICCGNGAGFTLEADGLDYLYETTERAWQFVRCARCLHLFLNPRPALVSASIIYPRDYYARTGLHQGGLVGRLKDRIVVSRVRGLLTRFPQNASIVDVGCGDGATLLALRRRHPKLRLTAVDLEFTAAQRQQFDSAGIAYVEGPAEDTALGEGVFDLAVMNQIIEHIWDVPRVLQALHHALRPGGLLSISTPDPDGYDRRLFRAHTWGGYYFPRHLNLFSRGHLARLLDAHGFTVSEQRSLVAPLIWVASVQAELRVRGVRPERVVTDRSVPWLAVFTVLDLLARVCGGRTSNQQCVAVRN